MTRSVALALAALVLACSGNGNGGKNTPPDGVEGDKVGGGDISADACTPNCEGKECGDDGCGGDCGQCAMLVEQCSAEGQCEPFPCKSSKDCPGSLVCADELGECVACVGDEDCPEETICGADHACHEEHSCTSDKDCKDYDMVCDKDAGLCVQCLKTEHCADGEYCKDGYCIDMLCIPAEAKCEGADVLVCAGDGSGWAVSITCTDPQYCEAGECKDYVCMPSEKFCDGEVLKECSEDGKSVVSEDDCAAKEEHCFKGNCLATVCEPGAKFCSDPSTAATCLADGMDFSKLPCDAGKYCDGGTGECVAQVCPPDKAECAGTVAETCNSIGSGYASQADCKPLGKVCVDGKCKDCEPQCDGKECGADGCGSTCGSCLEGEECDAQGKCVESTGLVWKPIPGGTFAMGCSAGDAQCFPEENPPHLVKLPAFEILETEVTEAQYSKVTGDDPSCDWGVGGGSDSPVECVTWFEAVAYCEAVAGRLCTEAEWEYAARGGTTTKYYCGDDTSCLAGIAWSSTNSGDYKHDVKGKAPNAYGLYDMLGNVSEWGADWYQSGYYYVSPEDNPQGPDSGEGRVVRGGCYDADVATVFLRVSWRGFYNPSYNYDSTLGFRCCRSVECLPDCAGKQCGDDGCGSSCGTCGGGMSCQGGQCKVVCGDGMCGAGENQCNCAKDCKTGCAGCCAGSVCETGTSDTACGQNGAGCTDCSASGKQCKDHECIGQTTPTWTDPATGLEWQNPPSDQTFTGGFAVADQACKNLSLDGGGWRLPTIDELRSLIRDCPATVSGGQCNVQEGACMQPGCMYASCSGCQLYGGPGTGGCYWPAVMQGKCQGYWSSSAVQGGGYNDRWVVHFLTASVSNSNGASLYFRCVR